MLTSIALTYIGLDVHKATISVALLRPGDAVPDQEQIANRPEEIRRLVGRWVDCTSASSDGPAFLLRVSAGR